MVSGAAAIWRMTGRAGRARPLSVEAFKTSSQLHPLQIEMNQCFPGGQKKVLTNYSVKSVMTDTTEGVILSAGRALSNSLLRIEKDRNQG